MRHYHQLISCRCTHSRVIGKRAFYKPPPPSLVEKYTMTSDVCAESLIQIKILHQKRKKGCLPELIWYFFLKSFGCFWLSAPTQEKENLVNGENLDAEMFAFYEREMKNTDVDVDFGSRILFLVWQPP